MRAFLMGRWRGWGSNALRPAARAAADPTWPTKPCPVRRA